MGSEVLARVVGRIVDAFVDQNVGIEKFRAEAFLIEKPN